jgi:hypothetical protein
MGILCILSKYHEGKKNQQKSVNFYAMQHPWAKVFLKSKPSAKGQRPIISEMPQPLGITLHIKAPMIDK